MKWLILLMIGLTVAIPTAMAQVPDVPQVIETKGQNYDLVEDYFTGIATWKSHPERIFNGSEWADFIVYDRSSFVQVESESIGSLIYDKNSCSYTIYETGKITPNETPLIPSVSWYPRMAQVGTDNYIGLDDLYNQQCDVQVSQGENWVNIISVKTQTEDLDPIIIQHSNGTQSVYPSGTRDVAVLTQTLQISTDKGIKETVSVFNGNPEWSNHKFALSQTVHTGDSITLAGNTYDIAGNSGTVLDRQWIEDNEAQIFEIADSLSYDFDVGIQQLNAIQILDDFGTYKVAMDFSVNESTPYLSSYTVDPTFGYDTGSKYRIRDSSGTSACGTGTKVFDSSYYSETNNSYCGAVITKWDISSISDSAIITNTQVRYDISSTSPSPRSCNWQSIQTDPASSTADNMWNEVYTPTTTFVSSDTNCQSASNDYVLDLGINADTDLKNNLSSDWWAVASAYPMNKNQNGWTYFNGDNELEVTYTLPTQPSSPTNLSATSGQPIDLSWTASSDLGGVQTSDMTYKVERADYEFAEQPLPINAGSDSGVDMSTNKLLYHLDVTKTDTTTSVDSSYDGTSTNNNSPTTNSGKIGKGWEMTTTASPNSSGDYIALAKSPLQSGLTQFTVNYWMESDTTSFMSHFQQGSSGTDVLALLCAQNASNCEVYVSNGALAYYQLGNYPFTTNTWHMVTVVYDGTQSTANDRVKLYIDGTQHTSGSYSGTFPTTVGGSVDPFHMGARCTNSYSCGDNTFDGIYDEWAFWSIPLTQANINSLYNSGSAVASNTVETSNLIAYYDFEQISTTLENQAETTTTSDPYIEDTSGSNNDSENPQVTTTTTIESTPSGSGGGSGNGDGEYTTYGGTHWAGHLFTDTALQGVDLGDVTVKLSRYSGSTGNFECKIYEYTGSANPSVLFTSPTTVPLSDVPVSGGGATSYVEKTFDFSGYTTPSSSFVLGCGGDSSVTGSNPAYVWYNVGDTINGNTVRDYNGWIEDTTREMAISFSASSTSQPTFSSGTIANQIDSPQITVKSSTLFDGTDAHSVAGWTKAVSSATGTMFSFENTGGETISYEIETDKVRVKKGTTTIIEATGQSISTTTPSHVMFTRDTTNDWEIFLDGTSIQTATDSTSLGTASGTTHSLGSSADATSYNLSQNSATNFAGKNSLDFTGSTNSYLDLGTSLNGGNANDIVSNTGAWTFSAWVNVDTTSPSSHETVLSKIHNDYQSGAEHELVIRQSTNGKFLLFSSTAGSIESNSGISTGWHNLIVTVSGNDWTLYVDNDSGSTFTGTSTNWNSNEPWFVGGQDNDSINNPNQRMWDGQMQEIGFWNRALTSDERTTLQTNTIADSGISDGLLTYYTLNNGDVTNQASTVPVSPTYYIGQSPTGTNVLPSLDEFAIWTSDKGSEASDIYDRGANTWTNIGSTTGSTVTFSDNNSLVSGNTYYHRIIANNGAFDSDPSNVSSSTAGTPPDSPTITSIAINDPNASPLDITLQWQNGASMGSGTFQNYVITRSADSSFTTVQTVANPTTTTYTDTVPNAGTWYYKVATTSTHGTSPNSSASNISTPTEPLPITDLAGQADSDVQTSFSWTQPSTGGSNIVQYKLFRDSINIANTTSTSYTDTGLTQNTSYLYNVFSQNNVGTSTKSNDLTLTTHTPISGNIGGSANTVGATTKLDVTVNITGGSPTPTFSTFTIKEGSTTIATFTGTTYYLQLDDSDSHNYTVESTDSNHWNNPTITGSFTAQADYEPAWDEGLSYDFVRANGTGTLFVNRDLQGWDINCQYRTTAEVMSNSTGITTSASNQWAYYDTQSVNDVDTLYLECSSNNETLFTDTTFAENRIGGGILLLDNVFSDWVGGVPIAMIFVIFVASLFTGRSSPTGILLIVAMVGVMGAIGLFAIDQAIWSLVLLASVLGIFVGKRFL